MYIILKNASGQISANYTEERSNKKIMGNVLKKYGSSVSLVILNDTCTRIIESMNATRFQFERACNDDMVVFVTVEGYKEGYLINARDKIILSISRREFYFNYLIAV